MNLNFSKIMPQQAHSKRTWKDRLPYLLAFFIPVLSMIMIFIGKEIYPFGDRSFLRTDLYHQYAPFFQELKDKLANGESLFYTWDIGLGTNFMAIFAYYLSSPLNWFLFLCPSSLVIEFITYGIVLKMALSSLTMTWYLNRHNHTNSIAAAFFGIFYGLSGYMAAYSWNIMWLDCMVLLPVIFLGLERLINDDKCYLYCISLGLAILSNYYIAIMICITLVIYFVICMILAKGKNFNYPKKILNFGLFSLLAGGLAGVVLFPEIAALSYTASGNFSFPKDWSSYFSMYDMIARHLVNVEVEIGLKHWPNIYCGVGILLFVPLYFMNKKVSFKEKISYLCLIIFFYLSFSTNVLNFIWHGFHYPNSLPCRQSFIYIFFLLSMSYEAFYRIRQSTVKQISASVWFSIIFLVLAEQIFKDSDTYDFKIFYISGAFILIYALLIYLKKTKNFKIPVIFFAVLCVSVVECTINMESTGLGTTSRTAYLLDYNAVKTVTSDVSDNDDSFYRMDKITGARSKNDGAWHNYHTISTFSSTCSAGMSQLYKYLGMVSSTNAYGYDGSTIVTNSLFSVKYLISNKLLSTDSLRTYYNGYDGEFIYKNEYTLPAGYVSDGNLSEKWKPDTIYNGIENQNSLIEALTGVKDTFTENFVYPSQIDVTFSPSSSGHMYLVIQKEGVDNIGVTINGNTTGYSGLKSGNRTVDIGYVNAGDSINVSAETSMNLHVYILNENKFKQAYNILNNNSFQVEKWNSTGFTGSVTCDSDGTFLFSIPYDKGWSVYIDGKKCSTYSIADALLAVDITKGTHSVKLKFMPVNLIKGCIITFICIIILIGTAVAKRRGIDKKLKQKLIVIFNNHANNDSLTESDTNNTEEQ